METTSEMTGHKIIPLFPLGVVLLPHMEMPLHIFEERYKVMINECLEQNREFGVVNYDGTNIRSIGCTAEIRGVVKEYEDGRMDIMTQGNIRFVIKDMDQSRIYLQAKVLFFEDEREMVSDDDAKLAGEIIHLLKDLDRISETRRDYNALAGLDLMRLSFLIPSTEGFTPEERQQFMEITSPRLRLTKCKAILKTVIQRTKMNYKINKIIGGNGDIKALL
ncbi:MAG: LON peptidase substrate-binding domain-containing protein [Desulfobacteraceae bacterium]|nr:LON peptidase substrate-binding domain-containing protein [Desulfobacteraceae bacterium]